MSTPIRFSTDEKAPDYLRECVVKAVSRTRTRAARIRLAVSSFFIAISAAGSAFAIQASIRAASESGFSSFASLALSDTSVIARHAQEFALSLAETLPGVEVALALFAISVFLVSLRSFVRALSRMPHTAITRHA